MKNYEKETIKNSLEAEQKELKRLQAIYKKAAQDASNKIRLHNGKISVLLSQFDELDEQQKSILQSQIYQKQFQENLKKQLDDILKDLQDKQHKSISSYLKSTYEDGFTSAMYSLHKQDIPIVLPIDQKQVVRAMTIDSKISKGLYSRLGEDVDRLKQRIANNISRGVAAADSYANIARNIANGSKIGFNNAMRITRTEGNRIANQAKFDASAKAKEKGADVLKQWDAALDGKTRPSHRRVDGEIRELEEKFSNGLMKPSDSNGEAAEVINCRCTLLQRARWALDDDELETLKERAKYFELDKTEDFNDFKEKYLKAADSVQKQEIVKRAKFVPAKTIEEAEEYGKRFVVEKTWSKDGNVSYKGLSIESANTLNETLENLFSTGALPKLRNIQPMNFRENIWKNSKDTPMAYRDMGSGELYFNPKILKNKKTVGKYTMEGEKAYNFCVENIDKFKGKDRELVEIYAKAGRSLVEADAEDRMTAMIQHEMGHHIHRQIIDFDESAIQIVHDGFEKYAVGISGYATTTKGEYVAESFCAFMNGEENRIDPELKVYFERLLKS